MRLSALEIKYVDAERGPERFRQKGRSPNVLPRPVARKYVDMGVDLWSPWLNFVTHYLEVVYEDHPWI